MPLHAPGHRSYQTRMLWSNYGTLDKQNLISWWSQIWTCAFEVLISPELVLCGLDPPAFYVDLISRDSPPKLPFHNHTISNIGHLLSLGRDMFIKSMHGIAANYLEFLWCFGYILCRLSWSTRDITEIIIWTLGFDNELIADAQKVSKVKLVTLNLAVTKPMALFQKIESMLIRLSYNDRGAWSRYVSALPHEYQSFRIRIPSSSFKLSSFT